jgi:HPt (histidine-containing phosphotransfer) domain-containing protein
VLQDSPQVQQLKARYKASLPEKSAQIAELQRSLLGENAILQQSLQDIHEYLHKLAGSAGMYDYADIAVLARAAMQLLIVQAAETTDINHVDAELSKIRSLLLEHSD